jgi:hypothetical protein
LLLAPDLAVVQEHDEFAERREGVFRHARRDAVDLWRLGRRRPAAGWGRRRKLVAAELLRRGLLAGAVPKSAADIEAEPGFLLLFGGRRQGCRSGCTDATMAGRAQGILHLGSERVVAGQPGLVVGQRGAFAERLKDLGLVGREGGNGRKKARPSRPQSNRFMSRLVPCGLIGGSRRPTGFSPDDKPSRAIAHGNFGALQSVGGKGQASNGWFGTEIIPAAVAGGASAAVLSAGQPSRCAARARATGRTPTPKPSTAAMRPNPTRWTRISRRHLTKTTSSATCFWA